MVEGSKTPESLEWKQAFHPEMTSLRAYDVWIVVDFPEGVKPLSSGFIFRKKLHKDGSGGRYKARIVVRRTMQGYV